MTPHPKPKKKKKKKRQQDKKYQAFIRSQPCCICGHPDTVVHHESLSGGNMSSKCSDRESLPLCVYCHHQRHNAGRETYYNMHDFCYKSAIRRYQEAYERMDSK